MYYQLACMTISLFYLNELFVAKYIERTATLPPYRRPPLTPNLSFRRFLFWRKYSGAVSPVRLSYLRYLMENTLVGDNEK